MKKNQEDEVQEGAAWMTTYSDMVTLLFTFFVLMFAISAVDTGKFSLFIAAFQDGGLTDEKFQAILIANESTDKDLGIVDPDDPTVSNPKTDPDDLEDNPPFELLAFYDQLGNYIDTNNLDLHIEPIFGEGDGDSIIINLPGDNWFSPGSADITPTMRDNASGLAQLIKHYFNEENPFNIVISGHTDNVPQNSAQYPTNMHLSSARASNFYCILYEESGINSKYFSTQGHGDTQPIAINDTEAGRQKNRRVEVRITQQRLPKKSAEIIELTPSDLNPDEDESENTIDPVG